MAIIIVGAIYTSLVNHIGFKEEHFYRTNFSNDYINKHKLIDRSKQYVNLYHLRNCFIKKKYFQ